MTPGKITSGVQPNQLNFRTDRSLENKLQQFIRRFLSSKTFDNNSIKILIFFRLHNFDYNLYKLCYNQQILYFRIHTQITLYTLSY